MNYKQVLPAMVLTLGVSAQLSAGAELFQMTEVSGHGSQLIAATESKCGAGSCGAAKPGETKGEAAKTDEHKCAAGSCGAAKPGETKGAAAKTDAHKCDAGKKCEHHCSADKHAKTDEHKCAAGKKCDHHCSADKHAKTDEHKCAAGKKCDHHCSADKHTKDDVHKCAANPTSKEKTNVKEIKTETETIQKK